MDLHPYNTECHDTTCHNNHKVRIGNNNNEWQQWMKAVSLSGQEWESLRHRMRELQHAIKRTRTFHVIEKTKKLEQEKKWCFNVALMCDASNGHFDHHDDLLLFV